MALTTLLACLSLISIHLGQLIRLNIFSFSFPLFDIFISLFCLHHFLLQLKTKAIIKNKYFLIFCLISLVSFLLNLKFTTAKSFFYLIRLNLLLSLFIFKSKQKFSPTIFKFSKLIFLSNIIFGLFQYFFWPDLTYFSSLNWDPHLFRLVSTFLDPTFTGLIYLLFFQFLIFSQFSPSFIILSYSALALTYSRSSLLSLEIASFFYSQKIKSLKPFLLATAIITLTLIILPQKPGEGTKLDRTSSIKAKIENYQQGFNLFSRSPLFGFGYNNLATVRPINSNSHANSGFDSSLVTIATTTGIFGLTFFISGFFHLFNHSTSLPQTIIITIFTHSLFSNSLLYPPILFMLFLFSKYRKL